MSARKPPVLRDRRRRFLAASGVALGSACHGSFALADSSTLLILAAASLKNGLDAVLARWHATGGQRVRVSYVASSLAARQVQNGAPADLIFSADTRWIGVLQAGGYLRQNSMRTVLGNRLALIAASDQAPYIGLVPIRKAIPLVAALGDHGRLAVADPSHVPAGRYARAALESLGVFGGLKSRLASAGNVRLALALVARGECPYGIVYQSDARAEPRVSLLDLFPSDSHPPIRYPLAIAASSAHPGSQALARYLSSASAMGVFEQHGFQPLA